MQTVEKLPPHNLEAEEAVLGALLLDRDAIIRVAPTLRPEDFYRGANAAIYRVIADLYDRREPPDLMTVAAELERRGELDNVGGIPALAALFSVVPTAVHVEYYSQIVERTAMLRRIITAGTQIVNIGYNERLDTAEALDAAQRTIHEVAQGRGTRDFVSIAEVLEAYFDKLDFIQQHRGEVIGVPAGYQDLDQLTGGFQKSDLIIMAARPGAGKTSMSLGLAYNAAMAGKTIAIFNLEMPAEQLVQRLLAMETGIDSHRLRLGHIDDDEWERISRAFGKLSEAKIYIDDTPGIGIMELRSKARRLQAERGLDFVQVDYLQLMRGTRPNDNRVQEVSEISRGLKGLARELNVPVLALAQLSRSVESRSSHIPMLSDLRESGCLTGDTPVYLPDSGTYRPIAELVGRRGFNVLALNTETWQLEPRPVLNAFATGRKPVWRMTTRLGRSIRATANHKFLTVVGWRRLDELAPGMRIALPRHLSGPVQATMTDEELALLGHLIGDGCTLARQPIHYTTADYDLAVIVADLATAVFGDAVKPRISEERTWYQVYLPASYRLTHGVRNSVAVWLDSMDIFNLRSWEKRVPEQVFAQPAAGIARFLRHLWATDGAIWLPSGSRHAPKIYYATSSPELARQVQSLLLRLSINAVVLRTAQPDKGRDQYHVDISGNPDQARFINLVCAVGIRKQQALEAVREHIAGRVVNTNRDVVPREVWKLLVIPAMQAAGITTRQMQMGLGNAYCGTGLYRQNLSRDRSTRLAAVVQSEELAALAQSDVYWDEIAAIEPDGEEEVYDLTVEGLHNFVAADTIVHNSIEQDADMVIFIYREEMYDPETEKKGIAELHIAKHRNGPVGVVNLRFFEKTTRFADLELYREPE